MNGDEREKKRELYGWAIIPSSSLFLRLDSSLAHPSSVPFTSVSLSLLLWLSLLWDNKIWHESQREREGERIWDGYFSCLHSIPSLSLFFHLHSSLSNMNEAMEWEMRMRWGERLSCQASFVLILAWPYRSHTSIPRFTRWQGSMTWETRWSERKRGIR